MLKLTTLPDRGNAAQRQHAHASRTVRSNAQEQVHAVVLSLKAVALRLCAVALRYFANPYIFFTLLMRL